MKPVIYIDGSEGTTGLQIGRRLKNNTDIELLSIDSGRHKDTDERKKLLNAADVVILCLPDETAKETTGLIENPETRVIDASSAHRTAPGWVYGLPELSAEQKKNIKSAMRVTNPGCHATGAILLINPLIKEGIIKPDIYLTITSLTGYSGGGKTMIYNYENTDRELYPEYNAPRMYSVNSCHKHIPEIMRYTSLTARPAFLPVVDDYPQGMLVTIPLRLPGKRRQIIDILAERYMGCKNIQVTDEEHTYVSANMHAGNDRITLRVLGFEDTVILTAQYDNLGKGAAGAAIQNLNIMLDCNEYSGLIL